MHRIWITIVPLFLTLTGCVGFNFERHKIGLVNPIHEAKSLKQGETTLRGTLEKLGPPEVILRSLDVNRLYYTYWDSDHFKFIAKIEIPLVSALSWDLLVLSFGSEEFHIARLEYDKTGFLQDQQFTVVTLSRGGEYAALDNTVVEQFLEDRSRALQVEEEEEDWDDPDEDP